MDLDYLPVAVAVGCLFGWGPSRAVHGRALADETPSMGELDQQRRRVWRLIHAAAAEKGNPSVSGFEG